MKVEVIKLQPANLPQKLAAYKDAYLVATHCLKDRNTPALDLSSETSISPQCSAEYFGKLYVENQIYSIICKGLKNEMISNISQGIQMAYHRKYPRRINMYNTAVIMEEASISVDGEGLWRTINIEPLPLNQI